VLEKQKINNFLTHNYLSLSLITEFLTLIIINEYIFSLKNFFTFNPLYKKVTKNMIISLIINKKEEKKKRKNVHIIDNVLYP
jgi:hypothetical protein